MAGESPAILDPQQVALGIIARLDAFRAEITREIFRADIPRLGQDFADKAADVLAFVDDLIASVQAVLDGMASATATAADIQAAFAAAADPGLPAELLPDGSLRLMLSEQAVLRLQSGAGLIDFGALGLGFELDASLVLIVDGVSGAVTVDPSQTGAFTLALDGGLVPAAGARLGFLEAVLGIPSAGDGIDIDLALDLVAGGSLATISGSAAFGRHLTTTAPAAVIPTLSADFVIGANFSAGLMTSGVELAAEGLIGLENITLDLGGLADFLNSVLGQIADIANTFPFGTIIDILTTPIPVIDVIAPGSLDQTGDGHITATDFILEFGNSSDNLGFVAAIEALVQALEVIDELRGLADTVLGGVDGDRLDGGDGAGRDLLTCSARRGGVDANLSSGLVVALAGGPDSDIALAERRLLADGTSETLTDNSSFEDLTGTASADRLTGDGAANLLRGDGGDDSLFGGAGDDTVNGGAGSDSLDGGTGRDWADYSDSNFAVDVNLALLRQGRCRCDRYPDRVRGDPGQRSGRYADRQPAGQ